MTLQNGPTTKPALSLKDLKKATKYLFPETEICALVCPIGIQIQLFFEDFMLTTAFCGSGVEFVEVTHVIYEALGVPQTVTSSFIQDNCKDGNFDISGMLYLSPEKFLSINKDLAVEGKPTFRYMESAIQHILSTGEFSTFLNFTPNWSDLLILLPCLDRYSEFLEMLDEDFEVAYYTTCTSSTIENLLTFVNEIKHGNSGEEEFNYPLKSIVLFENDISKRTAMSCSETNIFAEILINEAPSVIKLNKIQIEPDRYGRIRPVIHSDEITRYEYEFYALEMPTIEHLIKSQYQEGDEVEVKFVNRIPILGKISKKTNLKTNSINDKECTCCGSALYQQAGQLYCSNVVDCPTTLFYRMLYANSKKVLNLPFDRHVLYELIMVHGIVKDVPSLFDLDRQQLMNFFDTDKIDSVLSVLRRRMSQMNGRGFSHEIQTAVQAKFLDALSIAGLHSQNILHLKESLMEREWPWSELPTVLTHSAILRSYGISRSDSFQIATNAQKRVLELDTLVREF